MSNQTSHIRAVYLEISKDICEELERRGFATEVPLEEHELEQWIYTLLNDRLIGNVNVTEVGPDGWENDLTNQ